MSLIRSARVALCLAVALVAAACGADGLDGMGEMAGRPAAAAMAADRGEIVPAAARLATSAVLPRAGWTATASDARAGHPASAVLDGSSTTFWRAGPSPTAPGLPASITIDLRAATTVSGLRYLPPQAAPGGEIQRFSVSVSADGTNFGAPVATGTWAGDPTLKTVDFTPVTARYVRLTALDGSGGGGSPGGAAEIDLLGASSSTPVSGTPLPRGGWTASASDSQTGDRAGAVLDGDPTTFWRSEGSPTLVALPHSITIDMGTATTVTGLQYLPRQDGKPDGNIGRFAVSVSADGATFRSVATGAWADDATLKSIGFPAVRTTFVRLTALSEAGAGDGEPLSAAAEIDLLGHPAPATGAAGSWGPLITFPIVPVSAVLLPGDKLLTFSAYSPTTYSSGTHPQTQTAILDLATGVVSRRVITNTDHEMFCSGIALLPDGRVLVNGGSNAAATSIYSPVTDRWTKGPAMNIPRGYEGDATLSTGQVFTLGGSWNDGLGGKNGEVFTPDGSWRLLPDVKASAILTSDDPQGIFREDNHGWFFATANGGVFHAGPSRQLNWFTTTGDGSRRSAGDRGDDTDAMNGNAVMYDVGRIFTDGGATAYQKVLASDRAYTIDIRNGPGSPVTVSTVRAMSYARAFENSVVLPDGEVLVIGGQAYPVPFSDIGSVLTPELWNPVTRRFALMAPQAEPRNYHSVALLLPDGRVFSGGGGLCGDGCATNHPDGQIFTPPYLLNPDGSLRPRPTITSAPTGAHPGNTVTVRTGGAVASFVLVRMGAVTHTVDSDQRRIPLEMTTTSPTSYRVYLPSSTGTVVPGNYLLFAMNAAGTPSVSTMINIR